MRCGPRAARRRTTNAAAAQAAGIAADQPKATRRSRPSSSATLQLAGQLGATGTPLFVIGDRVMNGAVGYDALKQAIAAARERRALRR